MFVDLYRDIKKKKTFILENFLRQLLTKLSKAKKKRANKGKKFGKERMFIKKRKKI